MGHFGGTGGGLTMLRHVIYRGRIVLCLRHDLILTINKDIDFWPILGFIRTVYWNFMAFSKALKHPDPVGPEESRGSKSVLKGIFVLHISVMMFVGPVISLGGLGDTQVGPG